MPYVDLAAHRVFFVAQGDDRLDRPSLVLIHGAGGSHLDWPPHMRRLPGTRTFCLDLPGHGRSPGPGLGSIDRYADVVRSFIKQMSLPNVILGGHSMGGAVVLRLALEGMPEIIGLLLLATGARLRVMPALLDALPDRPDEAVELIVEGQWSRAAPPELVSLGRRRLAEVDPGVLEGDLLACDQFDIISRLPAIETPALAVTGTADRMTPLKFAQFLASRMPNARAVAVEGAGHQIMLERPEEVAHAVAGFLRELSAG